MKSKSTSLALFLIIHLFVSCGKKLWEATRHVLSLFSAPRHGDIKHWGIYSWQKSWCDQGNQLSFEYHMAKGSSLSEVRISERPSGSTERVFSVLSPAGEPQVAEGKLSVPAGYMGQHTETETGNCLSSFFSVENKHKPWQRWNDSLFTICGKTTVFEGKGFKQKNRFSRTLHVGVKFVFAAQPKCFTCG